MSFTPTPEQAAIVEASVKSTDNLIVKALAGAAKTSTLVLVADALPQTQILCLAFNKKIATEMTERLPSNCKAQTLNSLGHGVWMQTISARVKLDTDKTYNGVTSLIKSLNGSQQTDAFERLAEIKKSVDAGKTAGYVPDGLFKNAKRLMDDEAFYAALDEEPSELEWQLIRQATALSIEQGMQGLIDFNDQILLPTIFPSAMPYVPLVLVDESQDLSALNHATLRKLVKKRLIAVGDENQAIYGFRGAHQNSMALMAEQFSMRELGLSTSFRCPQAVVREAQWRAPHMRWPEWAIEGKVERLASWDQSTPPENCAIICRNNAPLFSIAIKLLKNGRNVQIVGNDIGKQLTKIMRKFSPKKNMPQAEVLDAIDRWVEDKLKKSRAPDKVHDQAECMRIFVHAAGDLNESIAYAEHIFNSQGPIQLMTGHKSKGLEFDTVYFLDEDLIRVKDEQQEKNLKYVIQTRAKKELYYVTSASFYDAHEAS